MFVVSEWSRPIYQGERKQILLFAERAEAIKALAKLIDRFPNAVVVEVTLEQVK
jgi:hypothetical protein